MPGTTETILSIESIDKYRNWCSERGRSTNTTKAYCSDLKEFLRAVGESKILMEEFEDLAMGWLNQYRRQVSPKTTNRRLTSLRGFARWAGIAEPLKDYITPTVARPKPHPLPNLKIDVISMLEACETPQQRAMISMTGLMGMRIGEALDATGEWFNIAERYVLIRGKGDKERIVPLSMDATNGIIEAYLDANFKLDKHLLPYKDRQARKLVTEIAQRANIARHVSSHDLRATFATEAYNHTKDIRAVQEMLGHYSSQQTEIYTDIRLSAMREAVNF